MRVKLLQIARLHRDETAFTANMTLRYRADGSTTPLFGFGSFSIGTIPAPGGIGLLVLAGALRHRRRRD